MGLKEGTLESLVEKGSCTHVAETVFHQMLQALDYLASNGIVHRDMKPENILYVSRLGDQYQFQLTDFGLCSRAISAKTSVGTLLYMAPEMFQPGGQTHKVDVWSLFVTMLWTLDVGGFRQKIRQFMFPGEAQEAVLLAASKENVISTIRGMAVFESEKRASAAQMLVECFDGAGLSTPRKQVAPLLTSPAISAAKALTPVSPVSTTQAAEQDSKGSRKNADAFTAAGQYRVDKARYPLRAQPPRQASSPAAGKRLRRARGPVTAEKPRIPGAFPGDTINT